MNTQWESDTVPKLFYLGNHLEYLGNYRRELRIFGYRNFHWHGDF